MSDLDVYLTANICDIENITPLQQSITNQITARDQSAVIIMNGDLTSQPVTTQIGADQLERLLSLVDNLAQLKSTKIILMTGDRDWNDNEPKGYLAVQDLNRSIKQHIKLKSLTNVRLIFKKCCPGPKAIQLNSFTKMIAVNSQWWNHNYQKPKPADAICKLITISDVVEELDDIIKETDNQNILLVAHHPMRSLGNYGGRYSFRDNLSPAPILGSILNAHQSNVGGPNDLSNSKLKRFSYHMYNSLYFQSNIIYASGHEHNIQIHKKVDNILINSGSPVDGSHSPSDYGTLLHDNKAGYVRINYLASGSVSSDYITYDTDIDDVTVDLLSSACSPGKINKPINLNDAYIPCIMNADRFDNIDTLDSEATVLVQPAKGYEAGAFKKLILGKHHRETWSTPVTVPYLQITSDMFNLIPYKEGGGRQTLALKFENEEGQRFTFRSVNKKPKKTLNYELRKSIIGRLFNDQTSAQHPFGALPVAALLDHLDILHATPKLYVLPDTKVLGPFQKKFGGMLGMLEENPGKKNKQGKYFGGADDILKSNELFRAMYEDNSNRIAIDEFVRARLFDILVGDWSKQEDNWKWAEFNDNKGKIYRPIPRDRDHVFSRWDGLLPWLADREWALPYTEGFDEEIQGLRSLVYQARYLDRFVANRADHNLYVKEAKYIQAQLTDERIASAIKALPSESFAIEGEKLIHKLKARRDNLVKYAEQYYKYLSDEVDVIGTKRDDFFDIYQSGDSLTVEIWDAFHGSKGSNRFYQRKFSSDDTKRIKIYGIGGEDNYKIRSETEAQIEIIFLGGKDVDHYDINYASNKIKVFDGLGDTEQLTIPTKEIKDDWERKKYIYDRTGRKFNSYIPIAALGYNRYNGMTIRGGAIWTRQRWDKPYYHMRHNLRLSLSSKGDYGIRYIGLLRNAYGHWDQTWNVSAANPDFYDAYYGQGNLTVVDPTLNAANYYVSTFSNYGAKLGLRRKFWDDSALTFSAGYDYYKNERIENTILSEDTNVQGANGSLHILPQIVELDLDLRDDNNFPKKGVRITVKGYNGIILNNENENFSLIGGTYEQYFSTYNKRPLTLGIKLGSYKGFGEVPYYLQPRLGGGDYLRGFASNRFIGRSSLYANTELRWNAFQNVQSSIPYDIGFSVFYDIGKVSNPDDELNLPVVWHEGYGFGIYLVPFDEKFALSFYMGFSQENAWYPRFTFGTALN